MIDKTLLTPGTVIYKGTGDRRKIRTITREWDGKQLNAELNYWGIVLGYRTTIDWDRIEYIDHQNNKKVCTRTGMARWADGFDDKATQRNAFGPGTPSLQP